MNAVSAGLHRSDYQAYQRRLAAEVLIPFLEKNGVRLDGSAVLDVGCGHGGVLMELFQHCHPASGTGIDIDPDSIVSASQSGVPGLTFTATGLFEFNGSGFDFIFMRDVLEHIEHVEQALIRAAEILNPGGGLYVSYAPYYGPFGGHQHNGSGFFSSMPWIHLLPGNLFRKMIHLEGNAYKGREHLMMDTESVLATRLTISRCRKAIRNAGLRITHGRKYLVRPDYKIKFNLPAVPMPGPYIPLLTEIACTGEELILRKI